MNPAEQQLKRIQDKLQHLLKNHTALQKENTQLRQEIEKSKKHTVQQQKSIEDLKQQLDILRLSTRKMSAADKKELEKRINSYLKEIDRCIALLSE
jgi:predicted  nucleic acid-binding Zn-ribbon protein